MNNGMYETPKTDLIDQDTSEPVLASRWSRLFASLIDTLIMGFFIWPLMYFLGVFDQIMNGQEPPLGLSIAMAVGVITLFLAINYKFLSTSGQTIGKKALSIKIVDLEGKVPEFFGPILIRYLVYSIPGNIPVIGQLFSLVNILFIFGSEKRCIHDLAAKTRVVKC